MKPTTIEQSIRLGSPGKDNFPETSDRLPLTERHTKQAKKATHFRLPALPEAVKCVLGRSKAAYDTQKRRLMELH